MRMPTRTQVKYEPAAPVGNQSSSGLLTGQQQQQPGSQQQQPEQQAGPNGTAAAAAATTEQQPLFPHLYGTIDFAAMREELPMERGADGRFLAIQGLATAGCPYSEFT